MIKRWMARKLEPGQVIVDVLGWKERLRFENSGGGGTIKNLVLVVGQKQKKSPYKRSTFEVESYRGKSPQVSGPDRKDFKVSERGSPR